MSLGLINLPGLGEESIALPDDTATKTSASTGSDSESKSNITVLDDSDVARALMLPDYAFIHRRVISFCRAFQRAGVRVVFYFESGSCDDTDIAKLDTRCKRSVSVCVVWCQLCSVYDAFAGRARWLAG